jgi:hypothetical protein
MQIFFFRTLEELKVNVGTRPIRKKLREIASTCLIETDLEEGPSSDF